MQFCRWQHIAQFWQKIRHIFLNLKYGLKNLLSWFQINSLQANPKKINLWFLGINRTLFLSKIWMEELTTPERLNCSELSSIITWNLRNTLKTNAKKLHLNFMLCRIRKFLTAGKARILANAFINSQFNYAPLIWMFARKIGINIILKIHYKILQVVYSENSKSYEEHFHLRARSLVVRNLRSDTKGLRFDYGC